MSNTPARVKVISAAAAAATTAPVTPPAFSATRISTWLEALHQFPALLAASESCAHRPGEGAQERRLSTTLLSPAVIEQLVQAGGETELLIATGDTTPTTIRLSTLARQILRAVPASAIPEAIQTTISTGEKESSLQDRLYRSVPWVDEVLQRRTQVFGARASNEATSPGRTDPRHSDGLESGVPATIQPVKTTPPSRRESSRTVALTPVAALDARLAALAVNAKENTSVAALKRLKERLHRRPAQCRQATVRALDGLARDFPNFLPLIDQYRSELQLKHLLKAPLVLRPTLLVGPPGIGKTAFMRRLCSTLNLHHIQGAVATMTAGWILNGKHNGWRGGTAGLVAEGVLALPDGQGLMLQLDELDKMPPNLDNFPVEPVLLELLEPISRQSFRDEFLELPLNLMPFLSVIATANQLPPISAPLLSRLQVVRVEAPTKEQMPAVVRSVDQMMRQDEPGLARVFAPLGDAVKSALGTLPPRQVYQALEGAYGCAAARSRINARKVGVTVDDVQVSLKRLGAQRSGGSRQSPSKTPQEEEVDAFMVIRLGRHRNPESGSGGGFGGASSGGGGGTRLH